ncbi:MAG: endonuclease [Rhodococcus sp.]|nr:endonuclease [Rhodococcus sp. (in: high G+C Gram-positive bacteria)]
MFDRGMDESANYLGFCTCWGSPISCAEGSHLPLDEIGGRGTRRDILAFDDQMRVIPALLTEVRDVGAHSVVNIRLASGRRLEAGSEQQVRTLNEWVPLEKLMPGARIAVARYLPEQAQPILMVDAELILLAHMIGDGSCVRRQPIRYASIDEDNLTAVTLAAKHFGIEAVRDEYAAARCITLRLRAPYRLTHGKRNPVASWLDELGLFGLRSYEKFVPTPVFMSSNSQIGLFLHHLWSTDGSVRWDAKGRQGRIYYASTSRQFIDDVANLLLRLEVHTRIKRAAKSGYRDCWHLTIDGVENQRRFLTLVGVHGARGVRGQEVLRELESVLPNTNADTVPKEVWNTVRELLSKTGMSHRAFAAALNTKFCGSTMWKHSPSRSRLARIAALLGDRGLEALATSHVYWDQVVEVSEVSPGRLMALQIIGAEGCFVHGIAVRALPPETNSPGRR